MVISPFNGRPPLMTIFFHYLLNTLSLYIHKVSPYIVHISFLLSINKSNKLLKIDLNSFWSNLLKISGYCSRKRPKNLNAYLAIKQKLAYRGLYVPNVLRSPTLANSIISTTSNVYTWIDVCTTLTVSTDPPVTVCPSAFSSKTFLESRPFDVEPPPLWAKSCKLLRVILT